MPANHNKMSREVNIEAIDLINVDLATNGAYTTRKDKEHFGLLLPEAATLKVETLGGSVGIHTFPAGWNPIAGVKVYATDNTIDEFTVYY